MTSASRPIPLITLTQYLLMVSKETPALIFCKILFRKKILRTPARSDFAGTSRDVPDVALRVLAWHDERMDKLVVTRHSALVDLLIERGVIDPGTPVVAHASPEQVEGRIVVGVLPLHLAAKASEVWEVPLSLSPEMRGRELTLDELRACAGEITRYAVRVVT